MAVITVTIQPVRKDDIQNELITTQSISGLSLLWMKYLIWVYRQNKSSGQIMYVMFKNRLSALIPDNRDAKFVARLIFPFKHPDENQVLLLMDDNTKNRYFLDKIKK